MLFTPQPVEVVTTRTSPQCPNGLPIAGSCGGASGARCSVASLPADAAPIVSEHVVAVIDGLIRAAEGTPRQCVNKGIVYRRDDSRGSCNRNRIIVEVAVGSVKCGAVGSDDRRLAQSARDEAARIQFLTRS